MRDDGSMRYVSTIGIEDGRARLTMAIECYMGIVLCLPLRSLSKLHVRLTKGIDSDSYESCCGGATGVEGCPCLLPLSRNLSFCAVDSCWWRGMRGSRRAQP